ncbi:unnamed protein product [Symbiodinium natans]|uniref:Uncharacterized protein n=1 Tax=Symbiodinium natans TaxID=878477 RepID=A0A812Q6A6_9DINO|nr:unnamed protein product [Symbiodinium natans]
MCATSSWKEPSKSHRILSRTRQGRWTRPRRFGTPSAGCSVAVLSLAHRKDQRQAGAIWDHPGPLPRTSSAKVQRLLATIKMAASSEAIRGFEVTLADAETNLGCGFAGLPPEPVIVAMVPEGSFAAMSSSLDSIQSTMSAVQDQLKVLQQAEMQRAAEVTSLRTLLATLQRETKSFREREAVLLTSLESLAARVQAVEMQNGSHPSGMSGMAGGMGIGQIGQPIKGQMGQMGRGQPMGQMQMGQMGQMQPRNAGEMQNGSHPSGMSGMAGGMGIGQIGQPIKGQPQMGRGTGGMKVATHSGFRTLFGHPPHGVGGPLSARSTSKHPALV